MNRYTRKEVRDYYNTLKRGTKLGLAMSMGFTSVVNCKAFLNVKSRENEYLKDEIQESLNTYSSNRGICSIEVGKENRVLDVITIQNKIDICKTLEDIRKIADELDIMRLMIENKKEQIKDNQL